MGQPDPRADAQMRIVVRDVPLTTPKLSNRIETLNKRIQLRGIVFEAVWQRTGYMIRHGIGQSRSTPMPK